MAKPTYCIRCAICGRSIPMSGYSSPEIWMCEECRNRLFAMMYPKEYANRNRGFTAFEVSEIVFEAAHSDPRFKLGDKILYSPTEIREILERYVEEHD